MKATTSLQKRLVLGLTLGIVLFWLLAAAVSGLVVRHQMDKTFDNVMHEAAQRLLPLAVLDILSRDELITPQRVAPLSPGDKGFIYLVRDDRGNILLQSAGADVSIFAPQPVLGFTTTAAYRFYGASALRGTLILEIADPLAQRRQAAWEAAIALLLPLLFLIPISLLGIWLFVRFSLRGVVSYRHAVVARGVGNLSPISSQKLPEEIQPIADAVNHLIDRLRLALEAEQRFTANSAHELRTPLAAALAQAQRLHAEALGSPFQARVVQIEASLRELSRLAEKLLQLAKAEGGGLLSETPQDLSVLLTYVVQDLQRSTGRAVQYTRPDEPVLCLIDPDTFAILARNLIENALKHSGSNGKVIVDLSPDACLKIINTGAVVPPDELKQLTRRFVRNAGRTEGFGLGLAIVSAIAQGVGAELKLASPATGQADGFEVAVYFGLNGARPHLTH